MIEDNSSFFPDQHYLGFVVKKANCPYFLSEFSQIFTEDRGSEQSYFKSHSFAGEPHQREVKQALSTLQEKA